MDQINEWHEIRHTETHLRRRRSGSEGRVYSQPKPGRRQVPYAWCRASRLVSTCAGRVQQGGWRASSWSAPRSKISTVYGRRRPFLRRHREKSLLALDGSATTACARKDGAEGRPRTKLGVRVAHRPPRARATGQDTLYCMRADSSRWLLLSCTRAPFGDRDEGGILIIGYVWEGPDRICTVDAPQCPSRTAKKSKRRVWRVSGQAVANQDPGRMGCG